jgi:hypothetical protein
LDAPEKFPVQPARLTDKSANSAKKQKSLISSSCRLVGCSLAPKKACLPKHREFRASNHKSHPTLPNHCGRWRETNDAIQLIQVVGQIATFFKIQGTLQTNHNAAGACNGFGLLIDIVVLDVTTCRGQTFQQAIKQHLNQLHIVRRGNAAADFDITVTLNGS